MPDLRPEPADPELAEVGTLIHRAIESVLACQLEGRIPCPKDFGVAIARAFAGWPRRRVGLGLHRFVAYLKDESAGHAAFAETFTGIIPHVTAEFDRIYTAAGATPSGRA